MKNSSIIFKKSNEHESLRDNSAICDRPAFSVGVQPSPFAVMPTHIEVSNLVIMLGCAEHNIMDAADKEHWDVQYVDGLAFVALDTVLHWLDQKGLPLARYHVSMYANNQAGGS